MSSRRHRTLVKRIRRCMHGRHHRTRSSGHFYKIKRNRRY